MDRPTTYSIQTLMNSLDSEAKVSELIDGNTKWWNTNIVKEIFDEEEAWKICSMVICPNSQSDKHVWVGTKNGEYLVRNAYHLVRENHLMVVGSS